MVSKTTFPDFDINPEFHTHMPAQPGAIDMDALTQLATSEKVNTEVLTLVLNHQVQLLQMANDSRTAAATIQVKSDAARREHELALVDRVMTSLPVVMASARELMSSPADTAEVLKSLEKVEKDLKSANSHRLATDVNIATVRVEIEDLGGMITALATAHSDPPMTPQWTEAEASVGNGRKSRKRS
jgi:hypothetical protein